MKRVLALIVLSALVLTAFVGCKNTQNENQDSFESALDNYVKLIDGSTTIINVRKMYPPEYWAEWATPEEIFGLLQGSYKDRIAKFEEELGADLTFSYEITSKKAIDGDELDDLKDELHERWYVSKKDVQQAYRVEVVMITSGSICTEKEPYSPLIVKINDNWYIYQWR